MRLPHSLITASGWLEQQWKQAALGWLYLLVVIPTLTDLAENGRWPQEPRQWITELVAGVLIAMLVRKVRQEHFAVQALTRLDVLTGLWNRRAFDEDIADECVRKRRSERPLSLVYIDLDNFKQINDQSGHDAGDAVLQQLATAINQVIRAQVDRGFRLGGDEFALLLPGSRATQAEALVTRLREHCERLNPLWVGGLLGISAGVVEFQLQESVNEFVQRADLAMYRIKQLRRTDRSP
jgi:diguanylate cyclase (GGDEF)-like protein